MTSRFRPAAVPCCGIRGAAARCCTTRRHKTHKPQEGAGAVLDSAVAYRWHAWFGLRVRVHEVLERGGAAFARCIVDGALPGRSQELPLWMLDAATCEPMRCAEKPVASAPALAALRALLSEALSWSGSSGEGPRTGRIGSCDRHEGDRHAASVTPSAKPATGAVPEGSAATGAGRSVMDVVAGADPDGADGIDDAHADRPWSTRC